MSAVRRCAGLLSLAAAGGLLYWSSGVAVPWYATGAAALRLSFVARPERIEVCRELDAEEQAALPAHMRRTRECDGRAATYRMAIDVDGAPHREAILHGSGLRRDRSIFVLDESLLAPGDRRVRVTITRVELAEGPIDSANMARGVMARDIRLDTTVHVAPGSVALVTFEQGVLHLRTR